MSFVGPHIALPQPAPALVVEIVHQGRIAGEPLRRGHILDAVFFPQAIRGAESRNTRLGGNAGACQHDD